MNTTSKKSILYVVILAVLVAVLATIRDDTSIEKVKDIEVVNRATCLNGMNSLKAAQFQKKMLDQQVVLSAAGGRGEEAAAVGTQVSELKAIIEVFNTLLADPKLNCKKYFPDEEFKL